MTKKILAFGLLVIIPLSMTAWSMAKVEMNGSYVWTASPGDPGDLRAEFTSNGEDKWDVSFYFRFNGQNHIYTGTAEGSLKNGGLSGKVHNERKSRNWTFTGQVSNGKFEGTHTEHYRNGSSKRTGTLALRVK